VWKIEEVADRNSKVTDRMLQATDRSQNVTDSSSILPLLFGKVKLKE